MKSNFRTVRGYELQEKNRKLTHAMEDYLEMIYRQQQNSPYIKITDLSELLNVKESSVTKMVQKLEKLNLLNHEKYKSITLTNKGKKLGKFLLDRHNTIEKFLELIDIENNILKETELMEHVLSYETISKLKKLNEFLERKDILEQYQQFKNKKTNPKD